MTQYCGHCQDSPKPSKRNRSFPNGKALADHTRDAHPGKDVAKVTRKTSSGDHDDSIADQVIMAQLRRAMGAPQDYDDIILEGFE